MTHLRLGLAMRRKGGPIIPFLFLSTKFICIQGHKNLQWRAHLVAGSCTTFVRAAKVMQRVLKFIYSMHSVVQTLHLEREILHPLLPQKRRFWLTLNSCLSPSENSGEKGWKMLLSLFPRRREREGGVSECCAMQKLARILLFSGVALGDGASFAGHTEINSQVRPTSPAFSSF